MTRLKSTNAALLLPLVLLLGAAATRADASCFDDPASQTQRHVGSASNATPCDLVVIGRGPDYPVRSRMFKEVGAVRINVWLTETGAVSSTAIERSSGYPRLDDAAVRYIREHWKYNRRNDAPLTPESVQAEVIFRLD